MSSPTAPEDTISAPSDEFEGFITDSITSDATDEVPSSNKSATDTAAALSEESVEGILSLVHALLRENGWEPTDRFYALAIAKATMSATDTTHIQNCPQVTECIVTDAQGMIDHERMHARERIRAADKAIARARGRIRANRGKIVEVEIKLERLAPLYRMEGRMVAEPNEMAEMKLRIEQYQMRIEYLGALIKTEKHFIKTTMRRMQADMDRM